MNPRQHIQSLPPGPRGTPEVILCHGCLDNRTAVYPGQAPRRWVRVRGFWYCPRCARPLPEPKP